MSGEPEAGHRVVVPWGVDGLIGVVKRVYGPPGQRRALVTVPLHGASGQTLEETTVSVSLRALNTARLLVTN
ncbi:MAG TPA: hypothetical protein VF005_06490 [Acidimicrobiales bacterium]